jgi:glycosyl transferase, family 25
MDMKTHIRVISLATAIDRRHVFSMNAQKTELSWQFHDAHTDLDAGLSYNVRDSIISSGRALETAELGCYSSHISVWREFLKTNDDLLLAFEDDVMVDWQFIEFILQFDLGVLGIDYLKLFEKIPAPHRLVIPQFLDPYHHLIRFVDHALGCQAYILTRKGAEQLLRHCQTLKRPIDVETGRFWSHGITNYAIVPYPVIELYTKSSIGNDRLDKKPLKGMMRLQRAIAKNAERINRAIARISANPRDVKRQYKREYLHK